MKIGVLTRMTEIPVGRDPLFNFRTLILLGIGEKIFWWSKEERLKKISKEINSRKGVRKRKRK